MTTKRKRISFCVMTAVMLAMLCCGLCCSNYTRAYADTKVEVTSETQTMYYMEIPLKGLTGYCAMYPEENVNGAYNFINAYLESITDTSFPVTFQFVFNHCTVNDSPVMVTWRCEVTAKGTNKDTMWRSYYANGGYVDFAKFIFDEDIKVNIRKEYYELLKNGNYENFTITHLYDGNGYMLYNEYMCDYYDSPNEYRKHIYHNVDGIKLYSEEKPADYDFIGEEGQAPDNGGFLTMFVGFFEGTTNGLPNWVYVAIGAGLVVVLIVVGIVLKVYLRL